jgi:hypothetical protein
MRSRCCVLLAVKGVFYQAALQVQCKWSSHMSSMQQSKFRLHSLSSSGVKSHHSPVSTSQSSAKLACHLYQKTTLPMNQDCLLPSITLAIPSTSHTTERMKCDLMHVELMHVERVTCVTLGMTSCAHLLYQELGHVHAAHSMVAEHHGLLGGIEALTDTGPPASHEDSSNRWVITEDQR